LFVQCVYARGRFWRRRFVVMLLFWVWFWWWFQLQLWWFVCFCGVFNDPGLVWISGWFVVTDGDLVIFWDSVALRKN
jgi:hypothetical protein